jgi:hypothetical protein
MSKLHLTEAHEIIKDGVEITLSNPLYNLSDDRLAKDNNFIKCWKCKDYFDVVWMFGDYHPQCDGREYCESCFKNL